LEEIAGGNICDFLYTRDFLRVGNCVSLLQQAQAEFTFMRRKTPGQTVLVFFIYADFCLHLPRVEQSTPYEILIQRRKDAQAELEDIAAESFDLKVRKARAEKIIDQTDFEIHKLQELEKQRVTEHDITGH
jgi:hypothetical protein